MEFKLELGNTYNFKKSYLSMGGGNIPLEEVFIELIKRGEEIYCKVDLEDKQRTYFKVGDIDLYFPDPNYKVEEYEVYYCDGCGGCPCDNWECGNFATDDEYEDE
jgi:hypothetical protein